MLLGNKEGQSLARAPFRASHRYVTALDWCRPSHKHYIERLDLANAARQLYFADGRQPKSLTDFENLPTNLCVHGLPELWAVSRDGFLDPEKHVDSLKGRLQESVAAYKVGKQELQDLKAERQSLKKQRVGETNETKQNILESQIDALSLDIEQATAQLKEYKKQVLACRDKLKAALQPPETKPSGQRADVFARLAKPNRATIRVQARFNGNDKMSPEPCLGTSMDELLLSCAKRLKMRVVKRLYSLDGKRLRKFSDLQQAQEVYASAGEAFIDPVKQAAELQLRE
eukprot:m.68892 g.68892  ORF g.68892 m.68892 type:complete len:286 (+) comp14099_c0_seq6:408-1265(+)